MIGRSSYEVFALLSALVSRNPKPYVLFLFSSGPADFNCKRMGCFPRRAAAHAAAVHARTHRDDARVDVARLDAVEI